MRVIDRLDCPDREGSLDRTGASVDGRSCAYAGPGEEEVTLALTPLNGATPQAVLAPQEAQLRTLIPASGAAGGASIQASTDRSGDRANIDLPGFHIHADGGKAHIRLPGVSIDADDDDDAHVHTNLAGGMSNVMVDAHSGGAVIHAGEAGAHGADMVLLLASDTPGPGGERLVGYIARGPASGPLVVATFKSKSPDRRERNHLEHSDISRLVNLNVKG